jgi:hypothetical protein
VGDSVRVGAKLGAAADVGTPVGAVVRVRVGTGMGPAASTEAAGRLLTDSVLVPNEGWIWPQFSYSHQLPANTSPMTMRNPRVAITGRTRSGRNDPPQARQDAAPRKFTVPHSRQRTRRTSRWSLPHWAQMRWSGSTSAPQPSHTRSGVLPDVWTALHAPEPPTPLSLAMSHSCSSSTVLNGRGVPLRIGMHEPARDLWHEQSTIAASGFPRSDAGQDPIWPWAQLVGES